MSRMLVCLAAAVCASFVVCASFSSAAEIFQIAESNRPMIGGKEVDWIDGDFVLRNENIVAVVGNPIAGRDANMTVGGIGACLIDLTRNDKMSDQLSAFYPTGRRYTFQNPESVESGKTDNGVFWRCKSSDAATNVAGSAIVEYRLDDEASFVEVSVSIEGDESPKPILQTGVRADRTFQFRTVDVAEKTIAYFSDEFFRQTYGIETIRKLDRRLKWGRDRVMPIRFHYAGDENLEQHTLRIYPASSILDLAGLVKTAAPQEFKVTGAIGDHPRIQLTFESDNDELVTKENSVRCDESGECVVHLSPGNYSVTASAIGHESVKQSITVGDAAAHHKIQFTKATAVVAKITDKSGNPSPAKLTFFGVDKTANPDFGLDSADGSVKNCVYTTDGQVIRSIPRGVYECLVSRGPEFDVENVKVDLSNSDRFQLDVTLNRVVDSAGWISAELHSHSSPSGDNTSSQKGRVENLVCEHLEFGPCTEHQRIESYDDHLQALGAEHLMATCTGIELTGGPLPINHQNAFPLRWSPNKQNGGGPRTSVNPLIQIQRIAMWDDGAEKVVQINHPNLEQMARDKDLDGKPDGGFASMFQFADVIEVHPIETIFADPNETSAKDMRDNRVLQWLRLIAEGKRIPGVVNTDAHYNWHGSGWLRNWVQSSTDDPAKIDIDEMTRNLEAGRAIMSTGPFMRVSLHSKTLDQPAAIGDTVKLSDSAAELSVQVQCANWLDINRVEVFVGGERVPELARHRRTHPDSFSGGVIKFDQRLPVKLEKDTFIVVAAIGEGRTLGRVFGEQWGNRPPVVVSNPIYVERE